MNPANLKPARKSAATLCRESFTALWPGSRFRFLLCVLMMALFCCAAAARDFAISLFPAGQRGTIGISYAMVSRVYSQSDFDESFELSGDPLAEFKYTLPGPVKPLKFNEGFLLHKRGESSMEMFHRRLPSRYNYSCSAALQTGYGQLLPASRLGQGRIDGAGPEDLGFFYVKMCLRF